MELYDILLAKQLAGSGGGGGGVTVEPLTATENKTYTAPTGKAYSPVTVNVSGGGGGDFSTATVTATNNTIDNINLYVPWIISDDEEEVYLSNGDLFLEIGITTADVILYKGLCLAYLPDNGQTVSVSGDIEDDGGGYYYISGNCTITIS